MNENCFQNVNSFMILSLADLQFKKPVRALYSKKYEFS